MLDGLGRLGRCGMCGIEVICIREDPRLTFTPCKLRIEYCSRIRRRGSTRTLLLDDPVRMLLPLSLTVILEVH